MHWSINYSVPGTPKSGRVTPRSVSGGKRRRSVTPSGGKHLGFTVRELDELNLHSPLAKRKKLADMRGTSGLRQEVEIEKERSKSPPQQASIPIKEIEVDDNDSGDEEAASSIASEDDFLAAELETDLV